MNPFKGLLMGSSESRRTFLTYPFVVNAAVWCHSFSFKKKKERELGRDFNKADVKLFQCCTLDFERRNQPQNLKVQCVRFFCGKLQRYLLKLAC